MSKKKYYAVRKGYKVGVFNTWDECKSLVSGYSGAEYKSFTTEEEAYKFIGKKAPVKKATKVVIKKESVEKEITTKESKPKKATAKKTEPNSIRSTADIKIVPSYVEPSEMIEEFDVIAFVDGSYDKATKSFGSGIALLYNDGTRIDHKYAGYDEWDQWNIVGELESCKYVLRLSKEQGLKKVCIYHDLVNIAHWASGYYQAKNDYTKEYVRIIEEFSKEIDITFVKVPAHSGFLLNEQADQLAKEAIQEYLDKKSK